MNLAMKGELHLNTYTQFNHPGELTDAAIEAVHLLIDAGAILANQTQIMRGINDDPETLSALFKKLSFIGATPYWRNRKSQ